MGPPNSSSQPTARSQTPLHFRAPGRTLTRGPLQTPCIAWLDTNNGPISNKPYKRHRERMSSRRFETAPLLQETSALTSMQQDSIGHISEEHSFNISSLAIHKAHSRAPNVSASTYSRPAFKVRYEPPYMGQQIQTRGPRPSQHHRPQPGSRPTFRINTHSRPAPPFSSRHRAHLPPQAHSRPAPPFSSRFWPTPLSRARGTPKIMRGRQASNR
ncbi:unnamed protein product [Linum trigynum]|uniref:Uncharacterized protein n=1 Tax=Linum trigynum TaxID=586398 RepID=A0AAV2E4B1_9ROSI